MERGSSSRPMGCPFSCPKHGQAPSSTITPSCPQTSVTQCNRRQQLHTCHMPYHGGPCCHTGLHTGTAHHTPTNTSCPLPTSLASCLLPAHCKSIQLSMLITTSSEDTDWEGIMSTGHTHVALGHRPHLPPPAILSVTRIPHSTILRHAMQSAVPMARHLHSRMPLPLGPCTIEHSHSTLSGLSHRPLLALHCQRGGPLKSCRNAPTTTRQPMLPPHAFHWHLAAKAWPRMPRAAALVPWAVSTHCTQCICSCQVPV